MDSDTIIANYLQSNEYEDLKDYEGLYKINKNGKIWSCCYKKEMKSTIDGGYLRIMLRKDGQTKGRRIHRLLALQYIENPNNYPEIDHIDRNPLNNDLNNLRWADKKIQNNNKSSNICNLTEDEQNKRIEDIKEYKRKWAEEDRHKKGIEPKNTEFNEKEYKREWMAKKRASMTPEEKEAYLAHRRETRPTLTEEQKEKARERAKKQREAIKSDPNALAKDREYKKQKAKEYREADK